LISHFTIVTIAHIVIKIGRVRMIHQLAIHEVPDHLPSGLIEVGYAPLLQVSSLPRDLAQEFVHALPHANAIVRQELLMVNPVEQCFHWPQRINDVLYADG
jgi:hypothetical protein